MGAEVELHRAAVVEAEERVEAQRVAAYEARGSSESREHELQQAEHERSRRV